MKHKSIEEKRRILAGYAESGQTGREYAKSVGVGYSTLGLWRRRQMEAKPRARLVEVEVSGRGGVEAMYRLRLSSGAVLELRSGFDSAEARALVGILREEA